MKRNVALLFAALCMLVVSTAQAATNVHFYTKYPTGLAPTRDVHYKLTDNNANVLAEDKVVDPDGVVIEFNLDPGVYVLSAEQPSTKYFGSMTFAINAVAEVAEPVTQSAEESGASDSGDGADDRYLIIGPDGLSEVSESELSSMIAGGDGVGVAPGTTVADPVAPAATSTCPSYPSYPGTAYPGGYAGAAGGIGRLGGLLGAAGLAGGIVGIATNNNNKGGNNDRPMPITIF